MNGAEPLARSLELAKRDAALRVMAFGALLAPTLPALMISFFVTPREIETGRVVLSPPCAFKLLFGRDCPTCGMTRAFAALSHGQWARAVAYNHLSPAIYLAFWLLAGYALKNLVRAVAELGRLRKRGGSVEHAS